MGFTFSHPVLILPARYLPRKRYSMNGLIIGSMIPDLEYFIRLDNVSTFSHTFFGLFLFDIPAALLVLSIYHLLLREPFISNLPAFLKARLSHYLHFNWPVYFQQNWIVVLYSILFGAITHVLWDSFTSGNGYFVIHHSIFETQVTVLNLTLFAYKIVKHLSSLFGALILLYVLFKLPKMEYATRQVDKWYWIIIIILTCLITLLQLITYHQYISTNQLIKKIVSSGLLALIIVSLRIKMRSNILNLSD